MRRRYLRSLWICGVGLWIGVPILVGIAAWRVRAQIATGLKERRDIQIVIDRNRNQEADIERKLEELALCNAVVPVLQPARLKGTLSEFFEAATEAGLETGSFERAISFSEGDAGLFAGVTGKSAQRVTIEVTARMQTQLALWFGLESAFPNLRLLNLEWSASASTRTDGRPLSTTVRAIYLIQNLYGAQPKVK